MGYEDKIKNNILNKGNSYGLDMEANDDNKQHETILFRGCTSKLREKELIESVGSCLDKKSIEYDILPDETCCGIMLFILNDMESAKKVVDKNVEKFNKHGVKKIITICPGCYESFTEHYANHPDFNMEVIFAMELFQDERVDGTNHIIHDPCHALDRAEEVRSIVQNVPTKRANSCCGFGAGITAGSKELTLKMAKQTLSGKKVITYCPSCYHTLNKVNSDNVVDLFTLINENI